MIAIDDILVSDEILTECFSCNYEECKGACCVVGEAGAPLGEGEAELLERDWEQYSPVMTPEGRDAVAAKGFSEIDRDGDTVTPLMDPPAAVRAATGNREMQDAANCPCAYAFFENEACLCAVERAQILKCGGCLKAGASAPGGEGDAAGACPAPAGDTFTKPISCRLYPIREVTFSDGSKALNLHRWSLCSGAFEKGRKEGIKVYQFLKEPIIAAYGADFYAQLTAADSILQELSGN
ncbi:MAG: DUF3109 family protein [Bacteroidales bacterium]|nr:DUF3109 family protein [Bacteroidales bacterium]